MERTLYLNDKDHLMVKKDGPSLWIVEKGKAGRRVLVRLIGQVVVTGNVRLEAGMITMLAESGVPVTFVNRGGTGVTTALAMEMHITSLRARVERFRQSRKGRSRMIELLTSWRRTLMARLMVEFLPRIREVIGSKGLREREYMEYLNHLLLGTEDKGIGAVRGILDGLFHELTLKKVMDLGLDPHAGFVNLHGNFAFVKDMR